MKLFSSLYNWTMRQARHAKAPYYLAALSFAESSFFPIPPDIMLAPMSLAQPAKAWKFALLTAIASVVGGMLGYLIGMLAFDLVRPWLLEWGYWHAYEQSQAWFVAWGFWAVFVAGFSPVPYKVFTIAAGVIGMSFPLFVLASFIGRSARFFLVAGLMAWGGEPMEAVLRRWVDTIGWLMVLLVLAGALLWHFL
ncbi:MAG: DedA family protein [gamma proteobacterium symbiont of Bathyaustriella thionipta]|nr:DedA family protein [gamma proteobacterium symbiont of Bathyaustriella thionipta]